MAIAYLNPAAIITNTNWDSSNLSLIAQGQTSNYWTSTNPVSATIRVTLSDFDNSGVASIDSIKVAFVGLHDIRSGDFGIKTAIMNASQVSFYQENISVGPGGGAPQTYYGTVRTTSDGAAAWTDGDLDGLVLSFLCINMAHPAGAIMQQMYVHVEYTEVSGYANDIMDVGTANIGKVMEVETANISKVMDS